MKTYKYIVILLILILLPASSYASNLGYMHISLMQGDVQIKTDDTLDWVAASINMPLKENDRLWVPEAGRLEIRLRDGTYVRLNQNSGIELLTVEEGSYQFYLSFGRGYVNFSGQSNAILQIDTPLSAVRAYDSSKFKIDVSDSGFTELSVITGAVYAESRSGQTRVSSGKTLSIGEDLYAELSPMGPTDEWESWNRDRDNSLYAESDSSEYLPTELRSYASDFDSYGRWVNTTSYGYVWTPTFSISVGWSPYSYGRWVWIGGDYVWISYQPWGWAPYHYGRWTWAVSIGWCWIPPVWGSVYWGPGYVGWYYTPRYVSWVPLGPRDIYYGHGHHGPRSTPIVLNRHFKHPIHYQNAHIHNSVMSVSRDAFLRGTYSRMALKENPFQKGVHTAGRPQITPLLATKRPLLKDVPLAKRPPQMVRNLNTKELKKTRPLVTSRNSSVMKPETLSKKMTLRTVQKPSTLIARGEMGKGPRVQTQKQAHGKQQGLSRGTPGKQGTLQKPFTAKQKAEGKKSPSATMVRKQTGKHSERKGSNKGYRGKQPDAKTKSPFDRYQPYSKQKGSDTHVAKRYTKSNDRTTRKYLGKTTNFKKSRSSLKKTTRQEPRRAYTSRGSSKPSNKNRQQVRTPRQTQRKSSGSYKTATPPKRSSQRTYVSKGNKSYQSSRSTGGRGSGSVYRPQPQSGFSGGLSRAPSMGSSRAPSMGSSRAPSMGPGRR
jgi:hypothetical protein